MIFCSNLTSSAQRLLVIGGMIMALSAGSLAQTASAQTAPQAGTAVPWAIGGGIVLAQNCTPPKKQEGCVKDRCTGKYICCTKTSGSLNCTTMTPKKK